MVLDIVEIQLSEFLTLSLSFSWATIDWWINHAFYYTLVIIFIYAHILMEE